MQMCVCALLGVCEALIMFYSRLLVLSFLLIILDYGFENNSGNIFLFNCLVYFLRESKVGID